MSEEHENGNGEFKGTVKIRLEHLEDRVGVLDGPEGRMFKLETRVGKVEAVIMRTGAVATAVIVVVNIALRFLIP